MSTFQQTFSGGDEPTRRSFVSGAAQALLGLGALPLLSRVSPAQQRCQDPTPTEPVRLRAAQARNVIYLYMSGGMSHLDTFDPKPGAKTMGPTEAIRTNATGGDIRVGGQFANVAKQMDKVCALRGVSTTQGAHAQGRYYLHTSYELRGTIRHPSMGSWLDHLDGQKNPALPGHVEIGGAQYTADAGFLESHHGPLPIGDPEAGLRNSRRPKHVSESTAARRFEHLRRLNRAFRERYDLRDVRAYADAYDQATKLMGSTELAAFDISQEQDAIRAAYGDDKFGQGCLLARRLVEHGVRYVEVTHGNWDTHDQNFDRMDDLCPPLDRALAALLTDLEARGMLEETLVVVATEFGRTPDIVTSRMGRNHYPKAFTCLLAGAGVRGGTTYGATDAEGREIVDNKLSVPDFNATIAWALGLPLDHVVVSPSKRPFTVADKGVPATGVFA